MNERYARCNPAEGRGPASAPGRKGLDLFGALGHLGGASCHPFEA